jgi:hypothetical protein
VSECGLGVFAYVCVSDLTSMPRDRAVLSPQRTRVRSGCYPGKAFHAPFWSLWSLGPLQGKDAFAEHQSGRYHHIWQEKCFVSDKSLLILLRRWREARYSSSNDMPRLALTCTAHARASNKSLYQISSLECNLGSRRENRTSWVSCRAG